MNVKYAGNMTAALVASFSSRQILARAAGG